MVMTSSGILCSSHFPITNCRFFFFSLTLFSPFLLRLSFTLCVSSPPPFLFIYLSVYLSLRRCIRQPDHSPLWCNLHFNSNYLLVCCRFRVHCMASAMCKYWKLISILMRINSKWPTWPERRCECFYFIHLVNCFATMNLTITNNSNNPFPAEWNGLEPSWKHQTWFSLSYLFFSCRHVMCVVACGFYLATSQLFERTSRVNEDGKLYNRIDNIHIVLYNTEYTEYTEYTYVASKP